MPSEWLMAVGNEEETCGQTVCCVSEGPFANRCHEENVDEMRWGTGIATKCFVALTQERRALGCEMFWVLEGLWSSRE